MENDYEYIFKIVLIGDSGVGKTNLLSKLTQNKFSTNLKPTIGVEFATEIFSFENTKVKAQIWDTAGQERYRAITSAYYRGSYGALIVYDITNRESFDRAINQWLPQLIEFATVDVIPILIGNKSDLKNERKVDFKEGNSAAAANKMLFLETSALTGEQVRKAFEMLMKKVYNKNKMAVINELEEGSTIRSKKVTDEKKDSHPFICC